MDEPFSKRWIVDGQTPRSILILRTRDLNFYVGEIDYMAPVIWPRIGHMLVQTKWFVPVTIAGRPQVNGAADFALLDEQIRGGRPLRHPLENRAPYRQMFEAPDQLIKIDRKDVLTPGMAPRFPKDFMALSPVEGKIKEELWLLAFGKRAVDIIEGILTYSKNRLPDPAPVPETKK